MIDRTAPRGKPLALRRGRTVTPEVPQHHLDKRLQNAAKGPGSAFPSQSVGGPVHPYPFHRARRRGVQAAPWWPHRCGPRLTRPGGGLSDINSPILGNTRLRSRLYVHISNIKAIIVIKTAGYASIHELGYFRGRTGYAKPHISVIISICYQRYSQVVHGRNVTGVVAILSNVDFANGKLCVVNAARVIIQRKRL